MSKAVTKPKASPSPSPSPAAASGPPASAPQKYVRRAELEAQRREAYLADQAAAERTREAKAAWKRKFDEDEAAKAQAREEKRQRLAEESRLRREQEEAEEEAKRRKRLGLPPLPDPKLLEDGNGGVAEGEKDVAEDELREKLRGLGEPAALFAETHTGRLRRYRALTAPKIVYSTGPVPTTLALFDDLVDMRVPAKAPPASDAPAHELLLRQLASYFTLLLREGAGALAARPPEVAATTQGKQALGALQQSREHLTPLFRRFEKGDLDEGVLGPVVEIVRAAQERRYVDANDGYLRLSIGKAYVLPLEFSWGGRD